MSDSGLNDNLPKRGLGRLECTVEREVLGYVVVMRTTNDGSYRLPFRPKQERIGVAVDSCKCQS